MTKSIKKALEYLSNQTEWCIEPERLSGVTVDRSRQQEIIEHTLKELEALIRTEKLKLLDVLEEKAQEYVVIGEQLRGLPYFITVDNIKAERNKLEAEL